VDPLNTLFAGYHSERRSTHIKHMANHCNMVSFLFAKTKEFLYSCLRRTFSYVFDRFPTSIFERCGEIIVFCAYRCRTCLTYFEHVFHTRRRTLFIIHRFSNFQTPIFTFILHICDINMCLKCPWVSSCNISEQRKNAAATTNYMFKHLQQRR
jgi:hypothetical protein